MNLSSAFRFVLMVSEKKIKRQQDFVIQVLQTHKIDMEKVDITDPTKEHEKTFMRENSVPRGQKVPLPPQIFNDFEYCGDYDGLLDANENEEVHQFLKLVERESVSMASVSLSEVNANEKGYISGISVKDGQEHEQTDFGVTPHTEQEQEADVEPCSTEVTQVSKVVLGVLNPGDVNDNVKDASSEDSSDGESAQEGDAADAQFAYERLPPEAATVEEEDPPEISARVVKKSEQRKSKDMHNYENVLLTTAGVSEVSADTGDERSGEEPDEEKHEESLSLHDSIEENDEKNGKGDTEDGAEQ